MNNSNTSNTNPNPQDLSLNTNRTPVNDSSGEIHRNTVSTTIHPTIDNQEDVHDASLLMLSLKGPDCCSPLNTGISRNIKDTTSANLRTPIFSPVSAMTGISSYSNNRMQALRESNNHSDYYHDYFGNSDYGISTPSANTIEPAFNNVGPSPFTKSPTRADIQMALRDAATETKRNADFLRETYDDISKRRRRTFSAKNILSFLRTKAVEHLKNMRHDDVHELNYDLMKYPGKVYANWKLQSTQEKTVRPFKSPYKVKAQLMSYPYPITTMHHRLLVEDVMILDKDSSVLLLVSMTHPLLSGQSTTQRWQNIFLESWAIDPLQHVTFGDYIYYAVNATVSNNPKQHEFKAGTMTELEIIELCSKPMNGGVYLTFPNKKTELIRFEQLLENPIHLQLWRIGKRER
jgi:hypothetical protein